MIYFFRHYIMTKSSRFVYQPINHKNMWSIAYKGQMNQNFDIRSLASLKQLNTKTDHYKVYSPKKIPS